MNRGLVLSLCTAVAVGAMATASFAETSISLNLRYTHPNDPSQGGTWELVGITDDPDGIVGVSAYLADVGVDSIVPGDGINHNLNGGNASKATFGSVENVVYGQDLSLAVTTGVGSGTMAVPDQFGNPDWDDQTVLITGGTFGDTRPEFTTNEGDNGVINETDANEYDPDANEGVQPNVFNAVVRGDSVGVDGLIFGDLDRSGDVSFFDDVLVANANVGVGTTWDEGDFDASGDVSFFDDVLAANANVGMSWTPPAVAAIGAVPEPTAVGLALAAVGFLALRRRLGIVINK